MGTAAGAAGEQRVFNFSRKCTHICMLPLAWYEQAMAKLCPALGLGRQFVIKPRRGW
jgi:hypothetical protein